MQEKITAFVERYCKKHEVSPEEAMTHKIVQEIISFYEAGVD